jgi:hyperosmotically inducible protein
MRNIALLVPFLLCAFAPAAAVDRASLSLQREVRHELLMLPFYTVFDNLAFQVDGSTVVLTGEVTRPTLKSDAESVVKSIEGVEHVKNDIRVLPVSAVDDQIRIAAFRAIYGAPSLSRYSQQAMPPIHIIVENGRITLKGEGA